MALPPYSRIELVSFSDFPIVYAQRSVTWVRLITYRVDGHGPFGVTMPREDFTPDAARALIEGEAAKIRALTTGY